MKAKILLAGCLVVGTVWLAGCAPAAEPASDYKAPAEGSYKTPDKVPERAGRSRTNEGGAAPDAGGARSEGG